MSEEVGERAQREGILVHVIALAQELANEASAANVVRQVAEFHIAERVITQSWMTAPP